MDADSGAVHEAAVRAEITVSFVGFKSGLFLGAGAEHAGVVLLDDLGVVAPRAAEIRAAHAAHRRERDRGDACRAARASRTRVSNGRVLIVGGGAGMPGALRLAGEAALRVGAGLVTVAGAAENLVAVTATRPELIYLPVSSVTQPGRSRCARADVLAIGPGLGTGDWAQRLWSAACVGGRADGGRRRCAEPAGAESGEAARASWIITPHPGEAARLLGVDTARGAGRSPRRGARTAFALMARSPCSRARARWCAWGADGATEIAICERGNPGMATAGMGDVLTGVIAGLRAQSGDSAQAARIGVLVHALAGDSAAQGGQRGLIASDVIAELRGWVNP